MRGGDRIAGGGWLDDDGGVLGGWCFSSQGGCRYGRDRAPHVGTVAWRRKRQVLIYRRGIFDVVSLEEA